LSSEIVVTRSKADQNLLGLVQSYFQDHLQKVRGASPHTVRVYAQALQLLFLFLADRLGRAIGKLTLDDLCADSVLAFLSHLEKDRANAVGTRNCRLAAVRGFVQHALRHDIVRAAEYQRILAIRSKRARSRPATYLEPEQVRAILVQPNRATSMGAAHHALLLFLYNTGARVSEALGVTRSDLQLIRPYQVRILGKGRKERLCPLWPETVRALRHLAHIVPDRIFLNQRGQPLTRDGVAYLLGKYVAMATRSQPSLRGIKATPHVLRHSCAVALLQSGVDVTVIRDYLGHASIATTGRYISTNLDMKRDALKRFWETAHLGQRRHSAWRPTPPLLALLSSL
jgi:site-specific recombinase XerD